MFCGGGRLLIFSVWGTAVYSSMPEKKNIFRKVLSHQMPGIEWWVVRCVFMRERSALLVDEMNEGFEVKSYEGEQRGNGFAPAARDARWQTSVGPRDEQNTNLEKKQMRNFSRKPVVYFTDSPAGNWNIVPGIYVLRSICIYSSVYIPRLARN